jgi:hypothetical protein
MTDTDLSRAMSGIADEAPAPPVDLLERVAVRHRRYRRRRAATATLAALAVLAAGTWGVTGPLARRADTPAVTQWPPLVVPSSVASPPLLGHNWTHGFPAVEEPPTRTPEGDPVRVVGPLEEYTVLVSGSDTFYEFGLDRRVFEPLVSDTGLDAGAHPDRIAFAPHWIVWLAEDRGAGGGYSLYRAPRGGQSRELVAVVRPRATPRGLYATDDHVWWSGGNDVTRVSLADGTVSTLAEFSGLVTDGTAWARTPGDTPTAFRNLVTGERRPVVRSADIASLHCIPAFCLGDLAGRPGSWFVQRPDGSGRVALPYPGEPALVGALGEHGLLVIGNRVLLDPTSGQFIGTPWNPEDGCRVDYGTLRNDVVLRWGQGNCDKTWLAYVVADEE